MIQNDQQYAVTKAAAERFRVTIATREQEPAANMVVLKFMRAQLEELERQLAEYEGRAR